MIKLAYAWDSLIVCGNNVDSAGKVLNPCRFSDLIRLVEAIMNNLIELSVIIAVIGFIYIGVVFLTSGGDEAARKKAKHIAWNLLKGFIFVLAAWLIVYTITNVLLENPQDYTLLE